MKHLTHINNDRREFLKCNHKISFAVNKAQHDFLYEMLNLHNSNGLSCTLSQLLRDLIFDPAQNSTTANARVMLGYEGAY